MLIRIVPTVYQSAIETSSSFFQSLFHTYITQDRKVVGRDFEILIESARESKWGCLV